MTKKSTIHVSLQWATESTLAYDDSGNTLTIDPAYRDRIEKGDFSLLLAINDIKLNVNNNKNCQITYGEFKKAINEAITQEPFDKGEKDAGDMINKGKADIQADPGFIPRMCPVKRTR